MRCALAIAAISTALLTGCQTQPEEIVQCEDFIKRKLKAPSTYNRINASGVRVPFKNPTKYSVMIEYDAANAYGVPIRDRQLCEYPLIDGRPDVGNYIEFDGPSLQSEADNLMMEALGSGT